MKDQHQSRIVQRYQTTRNDHLLRPLGEVWDWQLHAKCRGLPVEQFYPTGSSIGATRHTEQTAKQICATCPVMNECRAHALEVREPYGIWGGLTAVERALATEATG